MNAKHTAKELRDHYALLCDQRALDSYRAGDMDEATSWDIEAAAYRCGAKDSTNVLPPGHAVGDPCPGGHRDPVAVADIEDCAADSRIYATAHLITVGCYDDKRVIGVCLDEHTAQHYVDAYNFGRDFRDGDGASIESVDLIPASWTMPTT